MLKNPAFFPADLDFLPPVKSEQFLPPIGRWMTWGGMGLVTAVAGTIALSATTPYNGIVKAPATARPMGEVRLVQASAAGTVKEILVRENQSVHRGDPIAIVDGAATQTQQQQLEIALQSNQQQQQQLTDQLSAADRQIAAESRLADRSIASSQADLSRNQRLHQEQQIITQSQFQEAESALELAETEMQRYQMLAHAGAISDLQVKEKEQGFKAAQARLAKAKAAVNPIDSSVTIAEEHIEQDRAKGDAPIATLQKERESLRQRKTELETQRLNDRQTLEQIKRDLKQKIIVAPHDGTLLKLTLRNPGQVVTVGETIAQLAPTALPLQIQAHVPAADIGPLEVCQTPLIQDCPVGQVDLRITAYPYPDYGVLKGAVRSIAPDVTLDPISKSRYYEVTIQPENRDLERHNASSSVQKFPLQVGMDMSAEIIVQKETYLSFILKKIRLMTNL